MDQPGSRQLLELHIADDPSAWIEAGFSVDADTVTVGDTRIHLTGASVGDRGIIGWAVEDVAQDIDGLPSVPPDAVTANASEQPNEVTTIDHVVVQTDDFARTVPEFERVGIDLRRTRTFEMAGSTNQQCFFWLGSTILELVGPAIAPDEPNPTSQFWGLAFTSPGLEATVEALGELATPVKPAVQRGRFISTLKTRDLDISVPIAIMSPHVPRSDGGDD